MKDFLTMFTRYIRILSNTLNQSNVKLKAMFFQERLRFWYEYEVVVLAQI